MKTPHAAGPYRWEQRGDSLSLLGQNDQLVLRIDSGVIPMNPDAKLLAAAPELLAALQRMEEGVRLWMSRGVTEEDLALARAAIAKAGGGR